MGGADPRGVFIDCSSFGIFVSMICAEDATGSSMDKIRSGASEFEANLLIILPDYLCSTALIASFFPFLIRVPARTLYSSTAQMGWDP